VCVVVYDAVFAVLCADVCDSSWVQVRVMAGGAGVCVCACVMVCAGVCVMAGGCRPIWWLVGVGVYKGGCRCAMNGAGVCDDGRASVYCGGCRCV
jgi:hypothetical protein